MTEQCILCGEEKSTGEMLGAHCSRCDKLVADAARAFEEAMFS